MYFVEFSTTFLKLFVFYRHGCDANWIRGLDDFCFERWDFEAIILDDRD